MSNNTTIFLNIYIYVYVYIHYTQCCKNQLFLKYLAAASCELEIPGIKAVIEVNQGDNLTFQQFYLLA